MSLLGYKLRLNFIRKKMNLEGWGEGVGIIKMHNIYIPVRILNLISDLIRDINRLDLRSIPLNLHIFHHLHQLEHI